MHLSAVTDASAPIETTPSWVTQLLDIGKGALAIKQQRDIQSINLDRLRAGLPPLDASDVAVGAKVAMDSKQLNKILLVAGGGVGGCQAALDMGIAYTRQRYAFGRAIASFQSIKHKFADMYVALELARANAYYGACALASDAPDLPLAAATARVSATDAYYLISKENIQVHGGMGFTWEFDCHLYYRRAQLLSGLIGTQPQWKEHLTQRLLQTA